MTTTLPTGPPALAVAADESERSVQGLSLRCGERLDSVRDRGTQLMHSRERQFHLGLYAGELRNLEASRLACGVAQQRGLADARLAADDQRLARTRADPRQESIEQVALDASAHEARPAGGDHR